MADDDTDHTDEHDGSDHGYSASAADPVLVALELCKLANNKTVAAAIKKLRRLDRQFADAQTKLAAVEAQAAEIVAKMESDAGALAERERAITRREDEFEGSLNEARDNLAKYYNNLADMDRRIRYRIMASADLLAGFNEQLQDLPSWDQLRRLVVGLPDDPPPLEREIAPHPRIDALSDTFADPHADRHGTQFLGTLTRDVSHRGAQ
jgi:hypothetical protein